MTARTSPNSPPAFDFQDRDFQIRKSEDDLDLWNVAWTDPKGLSRHLRALEPPELREALFPLQIKIKGENHLEFLSPQSVPLDLSKLQQFSESKRHQFWERLGRWLRRIHDLPCPDGFGTLLEGEPQFQTINAMMAAELFHLGQNLQHLRNEADQDRAIELLADLRHELSTFHPHGRTSWTLGKITAGRILLDPSSLEIKASLDLSSLGLRPPEFDLANLNHHRLFSGSLGAENAFWKGYKAVLTSDFRRRIDYFHRHLELQVLFDFSPLP